MLRAIGLPDALAHGSVRFGLGRSTTDEDVDEVAARVVAAVTRLRELSPVWRRRQGAWGPG